MKLLLLIYAFAFLQAKEEPKIELYIFDEKCIPIESLRSTRSYFEIWYYDALKYEPKGIPVLTSYDIARFDKENFQLILTKSGQSVVKSIEIPTNGIPVQLVINGEVAYGAWLWTPLSSLACDGVTIYVNPGDPEKLLIREFANQHGPERRIPKQLK